MSSLLKTVDSLLKMTDLRVTDLAQLHEDPDQAAHVQVLTPDNRPVIDIIHFLLFFYFFSIVFLLFSTVFYCFLLFLAVFGHVVYDIYIARSRYEEEGVNSSKYELEVGFIQRKLTMFHRVSLERWVFSDEP